MTRRAESHKDTAGKRNQCPQQKRQGKPDETTGSTRQVKRHTQKKTPPHAWLKTRRDKATKQGETQKNKQPNRKAKRNKTRQEPKTKRAERTSIQDSTKSNHASHAELTQGMPNPNETRQRTQREKTPCVRRASFDQTSEEQQEKPTQDSPHHTKLRSDEANRFAPRRLNKKNCDCTKLTQEQTPNKTRRKIRKQNDANQRHLSEAS